MPPGPAFVRPGALGAVVFRLAGLILAFSACWGCLSVAKAASVRASTGQELAALPFPAFVSKWWTLTDKAGVRSHWKLNNCQKILELEASKLADAGKPVLLDVLKARQGGVSTWGCGRMQHGIETLPGCGCLSLADKKELPRQWLRRGEAWHNETPGAEPLAASNSIELYLASTQSRYWIGSAEGKTPGMGFTPWRVHGSEVENWATPEKVFADLLPAVPLVNPQAWILRESTGEMQGSYWHQTVLATMQGEGGFKLVFLPWWLVEDYRRPAEFTKDDYTPEEKQVCELAIEWARANPEHALITRFRGVTPEQIAWRRWTLTTMFQGDRELFASRYPATIEEAFMGVGSMAIPIDIVRWHKSTVQEPIERFRFERRGEKVVRVQDDAGLWTLLEAPERTGFYALGADVAEGSVSDRNDARSDRDFSGIVVLNRKTLTTAAVYQGRIEPDVLGLEMLKAAKHFNRAWMANEVNSAGMATLTAIRHYERVMPREGAPDLTVAPDERPLDKLGWRTTTITRDMLIDGWIAACRRGMDGSWHGRVKCLSRLLAQEESTFVRTATGKREHRPSCHDDVLFAGMIALRVHQTCPMEADMPDEEQREAIREAIGAVKPKASDFEGGVDEWSPDEEEDEGGDDETV